VNRRGGATGRTPGRRGVLYPQSAVPIALFVMLVTGCQSTSTSLPADDPADYRAAMRTLVIDIAAYADDTAPGFLVVPQNGQELLTTSGEPDGPVARDYLRAIDGQGREDLFYGYDADNTATPAAETAWMTAFLDRALAEGVVPIVTDYCSTHSLMDDSYIRNAARGYLSFAADRRGLDGIPDYPSTPVNADGDPVSSLAEAGNFLYLLDPGAFPDRNAYLAAMDATTYDLLIVDAFAEDGILTDAEVDALQTKPGGARRLVLAYMSIGEAESYRDYWTAAWDRTPPAFVVEENPDWPGNFVVRYWDPAWRAILFGTDGAYLDRILAAGFDGVYLDIIDAFEYFEERRGG